MALTAYQIFVQNYFKTHPNGNLKEVAKLWNDNKNKPKISRERTIVVVKGIEMKLSKARKLKCY